MKNLYCPICGMRAAESEYHRHSLIDVEAALRREAVKAYRDIAQKVRAADDRRFADADRGSAQPLVGRVAHGVPHRVDRLRCLGNAVIPLCAEEAFRRLMEDI